MYPRILSLGVVTILAILAVVAVGARAPSPAVGAAPVGMDTASFGQIGSDLPISERWDAF